MLDSISWNAVARDFAADGSLRDIYVLGADLEAWQRLMDELRTTGTLQVVYHRGGAASELPAAAADAFAADGKTDRKLSVKFAGVHANCHFFTPEEIEFDIAPREIQGQTQLDALLAFMRLLADATGKDAILTPEGCPDIVVFRSRPNHAEVEYHGSRSRRGK